MTPLSPVQAIQVSSRGFGFTLRRSWQFFRLTLLLLWSSKPLILFPLLSIASTLALIMSFAVPLWEAGFIHQWAEAAQNGTGHRQITFFAAALLFYFAVYFVMVFFNSALIACAMQVLDGQPPSIRYGLSIARRRLPQLLGWVLVSAILGVVLRGVERFHIRGTRLISFLLGSTWNATTYFAVPVMILDSVGPVESIRRSVETIRSNWGEALVGSFSFALLGHMLMAPVLMATIGLSFLAIYVGAWLLAAAAILAALLIFIVTATIHTAVDTVFKALLFAFAQGRNLPRGFNPALLEGAFVARAEAQSP